MLCRLCLKSSTDLMNIFDEVGLQLGIASILKQHFWFEPKHDDISTDVCNPCWVTVSNFHEFYVNVEEAHRLLTERFSFKTEDSKPATSKYPPLELITLEESHRDDKLVAEISKEEIHTESETEDYFFTDMNCSDDENDKVIEDEFNTLVNPENVQLRRSSRMKPTTKNSPKSSTKERRIKEDAQEIVEMEPTPIKRGRGRPRRNPNSSTVEKIEKPTKPVNTEKPAKTEKPTKTGKPTKTEKPAKTVKSAKPVKTEKTAKSPADENEEKNRRNTEDLDEKILKYMKLICDFCAVELANFSKLRRHMNKEHSCRGYAICCSRKFYKRVLLSDHIEKHLNPECYKCEECDKIFADKQCLRNHFLIKHQPDEVKVFLCTQCPKKFAKAYLLEQHRSLHDDRTHICNLCKKTFSTLNSLKTHIKVIHENYGTMCDICAKVIRGRALFARHQLQHSGVPQPKVQCDKCGSWHKDKYSLQKHKRRHTEQGIPHTCSICGKISPNRSAMLSHQRYVHAAQRIFECSVCNKSFKKAIALREHMTMHTGEVLYNCPHCPKTFNSNANMHSHRKKVHPKEFEEARKNRRENITTPIATKEQEEGAAMVDSPSQTITMITKDENGETHNILVTTGDFNEEDAGDSIIFTVQ